MAFVCPRCNGDMEIRHIGKTQVERCGSCKGVFLDAGEFNKVITIGEGNLEFCILSDDEVLPSQDDQILNCIKCAHQPMGKVELLNTSGIYIDRCPECAGIWLDGGEQEQIQKYLDKPSTTEGHPLFSFQDFLSRLTSMFS